MTTTTPTLPQRIANDLVALGAMEANPNRTGSTVNVKFGLDEDRDHVMGMVRTDVHGVKVRARHEFETMGMREPLTPELAADKLRGAQLEGVKGVLLIQNGTPTPQLFVDVIGNHGYMVSLLRPNIAGSQVVVGTR